MKLFHSSYVAVSSPDVVHSRPYLDFGRGFYLTSVYNQAVKYAERFLRRGRSAWLSSYDFNCNYSEWNVLCLDAYNEDWLDFVAKCRVGKDTSSYDLVVGGIANDRVIMTIDRFFAGELTKEKALGLLSYERPNVQYCIRSQHMLDQCLKFVGSKQL